MEVFKAATFLIADDHPPNVALLEQILRKAGAANVHSTTDANDVLGMFQELRPDIVLLDLHMPGLDGVEVMTKIRAVLADDDFVPIVVLTADATVDARNTVLTSGANDFLTKPVDRTEVVLRTRNLLHTRALHRAVREHNVALRHEIEQRTAAERAIADALAAKRAEIEEVLAGGVLRMVFQPVVELSTGRTVAYEALARFDREPYRTPDVWFAQAAEVGLGTELELAALEAALRELTRIPKDQWLALNVSPDTAIADGFTDLIAGFAVERLVLEITEHAGVADYDALHVAIQRSGGGRLRVAVDDAGAGFASLSHILRLGPDAIKLDMSLVRDIDSDPVKRALASSLVTFAREISSVIIAEGIETAAELDCLRDLGVAWGQGYHLAKPGELPSP
jgi:EAL domain-containing protein (putative c-di-GMP-specific phosphodiesterase class I)